MSTLNRDAQLSTLSNAAYLNDPPKLIGDWERIGDPASSSTGSGFFAVAYKQPQGVRDIWFSELSR
jgi:hypothetical protein